MAKALGKPEARRRAASLAAPKSPQAPRVRVSRPHSLPFTHGSPLLSSLLLSSLSDVFFCLLPLHLSVFFSFFITFIFFFSLCFYYMYIYLNVSVCIHVLYVCKDV